MYFGRQLLDIHARALFTHDDRGRLLHVNEPWGGATPAPRLFLGRTHEGNVWRFRADLPEALVEELEALCADEPAADDFPPDTPRHADEYLRLLGAHAPVRAVESGPAYRFETHYHPWHPP